MMGFSILTRICVLCLVFAKVTVAVCPCGDPVHPQTVVCSRLAAEFVFTGLVWEETYIAGPPAKYQYTMEVFDKIKGIDESLRTNITIESPASEAECGLRLEIGPYILLSGFYDGQTKVVTSCDLYKNYNVLEGFTLEQRKGFYGDGARSYKWNCDCQITSDAEAPPTEGCHFPVDQQDCYFETGLCKKIDHRCGWKHLRCN